MSLLFVYVFFSLILHINYSLARFCLIAAVVAIDVFLTLFILVSTHRRCDIASETGFKQVSLNPDSDSLIECSFLEIQICIYYVSECRFFNQISP